MGAQAVGFTFCNVLPCGSPLSASRTLLFHHSRFPVELQVLFEKGIAMKPAIWYNRRQRSRSGVFVKHSHTFLAEHFVQTRSKTWITKYAGKEYGYE
jgi:hypothetical protein